MALALGRDACARLAAVAASAAILASLGGCSGPALAVRSANIEHVANDHAKVTIAIELHNPADEPVRLLQWNYTFNAGGASYRGRWESLATLPPGTTSTLRIPAVVPGEGFDPAAPWSVSGNLAYRSPSRFAKILYDLDLHRPRAGFGGTGGSGSTGGTGGTTTSGPSPAEDAAGVATGVR